MEWKIAQLQFLNCIVSNKLISPFIYIMTPFVEGWDFVETLGEGAYGE